MAYPVKVIGVFAAILAVAIAGRRVHHPFQHFGAANVVTTLRALLVAVLAGFVGEAVAPVYAGAIAGIGAVVAALDGVDGWLARQTGLVSAFGARFDVEVDALLIQTLAVLAWQNGKAGVWVWASGLLRYTFVGAGWIWSWLRAPLAPTGRGRVICALQMIALIVTVMPSVAPPRSDWIAAAGLTLLCYSFLVDILRLWRQR